jgi:hypothetical protein
VLGARYLADSGTPAYGIMPGSGLHTELKLLLRIGLTPREALAAATSNFADVYGWKDVGRIESERAADILILDADPLADLAALDKIRMLVLGGRPIERVRLSGHGELGRGRRSTAGRPVPPTRPMTGRGQEHRRRAVLAPRPTRAGARPTSCSAREPT